MLNNSHNTNNNICAQDVARLVTRVTIIIIMLIRIAIIQQKKNMNIINTLLLVIIIPALVNIHTLYSVFTLLCLYTFVYCYPELLNTTIHTTNDMTKAI
jgi:chromate transport protein ChrA